MHTLMVCLAFRSALQSPTVLHPYYSIQALFKPYDPSSRPGVSESSESKLGNSGRFQAAHADYSERLQAKADLCPTGPLKGGPCCSSFSDFLYIIFPALHALVALAPRRYVPLSFAGDSAPRNSPLALEGCWDLSSHRKTVVFLSLFVVFSARE